MSKGAITLKVGELEIIGESVAAKYTWIAVPALGLCLDIGRAPRIAAKQPHVLISHGHEDHVGALHLHIGMTKTLHLKPATYYMPAACIADASEAVLAYKRLNNPHHKTELIFKPLLAADTFSLGAQLECRAIATTHQVPSLAYCVYRLSNRLLPEYQGLAGSELAALRKQGVQLTDQRRTPILAYSGDSILEPLLCDEDFMSARVLLLECTYLESTREAEAPAEAIRRYHVHERHIVENAHRFKCEHLVLFHFSARYAAQEIHDAIQRIEAALGIPVQGLI